MTSYVLQLWSWSENWRPIRESFEGMDDDFLAQMLALRSTTTRVYQRHRSPKARALLEEKESWGDIVYRKEEEDSAKVGRPSQSTRWTSETASQNLTARNLECTIRTLYDWWTFSPSKQDTRSVLILGARVEYGHYVVLWHNDLIWGLIASKAYQGQPEQSANQPPTPSLLTGTLKRWCQVSTSSELCEEPWVPQPHRHHYIHEVESKGKIKLAYMPTDQMITDGLTRWTFS